MGNYYCLVTGLPDISVDDARLPMTVKEFKDEVYPELDGGDRKVMDLFYLKYDNANLLSLLKGEKKWDDRANICAEDMDDLVMRARSDNKCPEGIPQYLYEFVKIYDEKAQETGFFAEDALAGLYYSYAISCPNRFASEWFEFNLNLNNMLAALTARRHHLAHQSYIVSDTETAEQIRMSSARDFGLSAQLDYVDEVLRISDTEDALEKEKRIDGLKSEWLEENSFFKHFSIEALFVFVNRLELIERWIALDSEKGREIFRQIIGDLKHEVEVPDEFKI